jgi:hypothetical protein
MLEIMSLTRHILEIMVSKFSNIMININKVIRNQSTFLSGGVTLCTQNMKYFCHLSDVSDNNIVVSYESLVIS